MTEVRIVDDKGNPLPNGEEGEIVAYTPYTLLHYHKDMDKTAQTVRDGWLHTGDLGIMDDDGFVYLLDRKNDMIISGGMNVYTTEIENLLQKYPGVQQVAVIGVPHSDWGEAVTAIVVPKSSGTPEVDMMLDYCKQYLSSYKCPKQILFQESLPVTPYGKVDKKTLRAPFWADKERNIN